MTETTILTADYVRGWRDACSEANLCGAFNAEHPPDRYQLCIKPRGHTGMHDDMWTPPFGSRWASGDQNRQDALAHHKVDAHTVAQEFVGGHR